MQKRTCQSQAWLDQSFSLSCPIYVPPRKEAWEEETRFETEAQGNSKMTYFLNRKRKINKTMRVLCHKYLAVH